MDNQKIYNPKIDSKYHLFCSDNDGPCFYAFSIDDKCLQNGGFCDEIYKCNYDSFESDYELNKGIKKFKIEELEEYEAKLVWNIVKEKNRLLFNFFLKKDKEKIHQFHQNYHMQSNSQLKN